MLRSIRNYVFSPTESPNNFKARLKAINYHEDHIPAYFICTISHEIMEHPVMVNKDMRLTYDRAYIEKWHASNANDPTTRAKIESITPNIERVTQINDFVTCLETIHRLNNDIQALQDSLKLMGTAPEAVNLLAEEMHQNEITELLAEQREAVLTAQNTAKLSLLSEYQKFIALTETVIDAEDKSDKEKSAEITTITSTYKKLHDALAIELSRNQLGFLTPRSAGDAATKLLLENPVQGANGILLSQPRPIPTLHRGFLFNPPGIALAMHPIFSPNGYPAEQTNGDTKQPPATTEAVAKSQQDSPLPPPLGLCALVTPTTVVRDSAQYLLMPPPPVATNTNSQNTQKEVPTHEKKLA